MARPKGPEEFFEVFRGNRKNGQEGEKTPPPPADPEMEHVQPDPPAPKPQTSAYKSDSAAIYYKTNVRPAGTEGIAGSVFKTSITLRRDTVLYAGISMVLLIIAAFVLGYERGNGVGGVQLAQKGSAPVATPVGSPVVAAVIAAQRTPAINIEVGKLELQLTTLKKSDAPRAEKIANELNATEFFRTFPLRAYVKALGNNVVVRVKGGFEKESDERAATACQKVRAMDYEGRKDFKDAAFFPAAN